MKNEKSSMKSASAESSKSSKSASSSGSSSGSKKSSSDRRCGCGEYAYPINSASASDFKPSGGFSLSNDNPAIIL